MPITRNDSDSFPGAEAVAQPPFGAEDCCAYATLAALYNALQAAGHAAVFRGGRLFMERTVAEVGVVCQGAPAVISGVSPDPIAEGSEWSVLGSGFGVDGGEVWLGSHATWAGSTSKVEQFGSSWGPAEIEMNAPTMDGLPYHPSHVWVYVKTACGAVNPVGFETEVSALPP